jgi:hypothetical protein
VAIPRFICGGPHLCQLRIEGLVPVSKYWTYQSHAGVYRPSKPSSLMSIEGGFIPNASMAAFGEKLGTDLWISQSACCVVSEALFLWSSGSVHCCWWLRERFSHTWTIHRKHTQGVRGLAPEAHMSCCSGFPLQGVHRFESPWLSVLSNRLFVAAIK